MLLHGLWGHVISANSAILLTSITFSHFGQLISSFISRLIAAIGPPETMAGLEPAFVVKEEDFG